MRLICSFVALFLFCTETSAKPANGIPENAFSPESETFQDRNNEDNPLSNNADEEQEVFRALNELAKLKSADDAASINETQRMKRRYYEKYRLMAAKKADGGPITKRDQIIESFAPDGKPMKPCVFPSIVNGKSKDTCFLVEGLSVPICSMTDNFDKDAEAGYCKAVHVKLRSEGCGFYEKQAPKGHDCGWGFIWVNGVDVSKHGRGHNVAVLDSFTGKVEQVESFDTHGDSNSGEKLETFLNGLSERKIVLMVIQDEGSMYDYWAQDAIEKMFGQAPLVLYRDPLVGIGYTGPLYDAPWRYIKSGDSSYPLEVVRDIPLLGLPYQFEKKDKEESSTGESPTAPDQKSQTTRTSTKILKLEIKIESAFTSSQIEIKQGDLAENAVMGTGTHVTLIDYNTGKTYGNEVFDTSTRKGAVRFRNYLKNAPERCIMIVATAGDMMDYMGLVARHLKKFGSERPPTREGGNYAFLGYTGPEKEHWVQTDITSYDDGPATIEAVIELEIEPTLTESPSLAPLPVETKPPKPVETVNPLPAEGTCGWRKIHSYVIGGENARRGEWPWQIGLYMYGFFGCGGSLISDRWVVTAAHCVYDDFISESSYTIVVGDFNKEKDEGTEKTYKVKQIIKHPEFTFQSLDKDVALIELQEPVEFNRYVQPVCLADLGDDVPVGSTCYITGWGKINHTGDSHHILQKAKLPPVSDEECIKKLKTSPVAEQFEISEYMLCAGVESTILSGCHGDSGGPYVCQMEDGHWVLQGAVSWGSTKCDANENFTVFAKISALRDWINEKIGYADEDQDIYT